MPKPEREKPKHDTVMDVTEEQIARVYAQAFLGVVAKSADSSTLVEELESIVTDVLDKFPKLGDMFRSAFVSNEDKQRVFDKILSGLASKEVLNFLKVLATRQRLNLLRPIARHVRKLNDERLGITEVEVHVAHDLSDALKKQIADQARAFLGREPALKITVNPNLLGGIMLRVGDRVFDSTLSTRLQIARKKMIDNAIELIVTKPERFITG